MRQILRCLSRVADGSSSADYQPLRPGAKDRRRRPWEAAEGHVPVYVGEEMERFEVPADLLGRPALVELLRWSAQEYGYDQRGPLRIPCPVPLFRRVLRSLLASDDVSAAADVELLRATAATDEYGGSAADL